MDFAFSEDQDELRVAARRLLADRITPERIHALADAIDPGDERLWRELVALGWVGLSTSDGGGTFLDEAVLLEEAGYALLPAPLLASVVCGPALAGPSDGDPTKPTALAWAEPAGPRAFDAPEAVASVAGLSAAGWRLTGVKSDVPDLNVANQVVVLARTSDGPALFVLRPNPADVDMLPTTDGTRQTGILSMKDAVGSLCADAAQTPAVLVAMRRRAEAGLALESVGIAQRMLDVAADHAKRREQFGRVIGTYQGVSHRIADLYVRTELARSLAYRAAWCVATSETEPDALTSIEVDVACAAAKATATEAAVFAAEGAIQVLGGIGMTWEHVAHRYYKRALANEAYAGSPSQHRATVADALLGARQ